MSGHWESSGTNNNNASSKKYYCTVSGGYAIVGARILDPKEGLQFVEFDKCTIEDFNKSTVKNYVKQNLGDKILGEVQVKIAKLVANRNKATAAPAKES